MIGPWRSVGGVAKRPHALRPDLGTEPADIGRAKIHLSRFKKESILFTGTMASYEARRPIPKGLVLHQLAGSNEFSPYHLSMY
jgi:hypothetical protein